MYSKCSIYPLATAAKGQVKAPEQPICNNEDDDEEGERHLQH